MTGKEWKQVPPPPRKKVSQTRAFIPTQGAWANTRGTLELEVQVLVFGEMGGRERSGRLRLKHLHSWGDVTQHPSDEAAGLLRSRAIRFVIFEASGSASRFIVLGKYSESLKKKNKFQIQYRGFMGYSSRDRTHGHCCNDKMLGDNSVSCQ